MKIDSHQHFWNYSAAAYPWISADMERLARDYLPGDLQPLAESCGLGGSVAVQALIWGGTATRFYNLT